jgi:PIN domain nuclease of toxin-antitoxin system
MRLLLDTHLLLWLAEGSVRLPAEVAELVEDARTMPMFSAVSLWEVAIKGALDRADFTVQPQVLYRALLDNGYEELPVTGAHAVAVGNLPALHRDPFDRLLIAQAMVEGVILLTSDAQVAAYPAPVRLV